MKEYIQYIFMRSDLASLNPGKAIAQGAHAANVSVEHFKSKYHKGWASWAGDRLFGTTVVLNIGTEHDIHALIYDIVNIAPSEPEQVPTYGVITDPTYPVRDGKVTHLIPLVTCAYAFIEVGSEFHEYVRNNWSLYR